MRILVPLLVITGFVAIGIRAANRPQQDLERQRIEAGWHLARAQPDEGPAQIAAIERHLAAYGEDPDVRFFVARAFLEHGQADRAVDVIWGQDGLEHTPAVARRLAGMLVRGLGYRDEEGLRQPEPWASNALLLLADARDPQALAQLDHLLTEVLEGAFVNSFSGVWTFATQPTVERFAAAMRSRGEHEAHVVAALATLGPDPYPEREADLARLQDLVEGPLRREQPLVWALAVQAFGRSEEASALEALEALREGLRGSREVRDREDALAVASALVAGGRWAAAEDLGPYLELPASGLPHRTWYALAVVHRLRRGDPDAPRHLEVLLDSLRRVPDPPLRIRMAYEALLDGPVAPGGAELLVPVLSAPGAFSGERAVLAAHLLRHGDPAGLERVMTALRELIAEGWTRTDPTIGNVLLLSPLALTLQALLLPQEEGLSVH